MSHNTKPVVDRSQAQTLSGKPTAAQPSRSKKQPSEMLERWKAQSRGEAPFTEKIYVKSQDQGQGSRR